MAYDLNLFWKLLPKQLQCIPIDAESEFALHAARWPLADFASFAEFVRFTYRYSCVLQPFISDPKRSDLAGWFYADQLLMNVPMPS